MKLLGNVIFSGLIFSGPLEKIVVHMQLVMMKPVDTGLPKLDKYRTNKRK